MFYQVRTSRSFLLLLSGLLMLTGCDATGQLKGEVVRVADGDTFTLLVDKRSYKIRLYGIDAPEKSQDFYNVSRELLSRLAAGKQVSVVEKGKDRYGRIVGIAYVDGLNINEELLKAGGVWHFKGFDSNARWAALENNARRARVGLWRNDHPVPPWEFRKSQRVKRRINR